MIIYIIMEAAIIFAQPVKMSLILILLLYVYIEIVYKIRYQFYDDMFIYILVQ